MKASDWTWGIVVVLAALGGLAYYAYRAQGPSAPAPETSSLPAPPPADPAAELPPENRIENPVPPVEPADAGASLPQLDASDAPLQRELQSLLGDAPLESLLIPKELVRRFVVTVDNLPRDSLPQRARVFALTGGLPVVEPQGDRLLLDPDRNGARYRQLVQALQNLDAATLASLYFRYYPLCQQAYEELGFRGRYFNDRLIQVIDHLLATPRVVGPIEVARPKVLYVYADPQLEALSVGQKALIRMGPQAEPVKHKLRELRQQIARTGAVE